MTAAQPYWREAGAGPAIVCLHANASVSGQWRSLMARLADRFTLLAPDSYGSGQSPDWPSGDTITLQDEVDLLEPVFQRAGSRFVLLGHSYGAAVALRAAVSNPARVRALVVYEPTLFSLIDADGPSPNDADGIRQVVATVGAALEKGDDVEAARCFIDYWMGPGSWAQTPEKQKVVVAQSIRNARRWAHALFTEPTSLEQFRGLQMPVLSLTGARSTQAAHGVARRLEKVLPNVTHIELPLGHMGPVTDADVVNQVIEAFVVGLSGCASAPAPG
jgi:pimeloyl-ACP methyl ester carboxylesterase